MNTGLFFGSFNPIHIGHLIIANIMLEKADLEEIWFVVSPRNPLKDSASLLHEFDRMDMVEAAIADNNRFRATDIEFNMPRPSYTVDTLAYLAAKNPGRHFSLIIGEDNLRSFHKWKNYQTILDNYGLYVYPRPGSAKKAKSSQLREAFMNHPNVTVVEAPLLAISATFIRNLVKEEKSVRYLTPDSVAELIQRKKFYR